MPATTRKSGQSGRGRDRRDHLSDSGKAILKLQEFLPYLLNRAGLRIEIGGLEALAPLRDLLEREGRGRGEVVLIPRTGPGQEVELTLPGRWNVSPRLAQAMKVLPGVEAVEAA